MPKLGTDPEELCHLKTELSEERYLAERALKN